MAPENCAFENALSKKMHPKVLIWPYVVSLWRRPDDPKIPTAPSCKAGEIPTSGFLRYRVNLVHDQAQTALKENASGFVLMVTVGIEYYAP